MLKHTVILRAAETRLGPHFLSTAEPLRPQWKLDAEFTQTPSPGNRGLMRHARKLRASTLVVRVPRCSDVDPGRNN